MTYYIRSGASIKIASADALTVSEKLPVGTYTVKQNSMTGEFFLDPIEDYTFSGKVYGEANRMTDRILNTFSERENATGVMLAGEQGSGKTLQAKLLSIEGRNRGISTISINEAWYGEEFNSFIQSIDDAAIVFFDEFEKVYEKEEQEKMLTLLDGAYPSKKLYVITCNDTYRINQHMQNRPGRIYYRLDYTGLEQNFIEEYCRDNLNNKSETDQIIKISSFFGEFNFDMLKAIVEEMNRYGETALEVMRVINAKPQDSNDTTYDFELRVKGKLIGPDKLYAEEWHGNPLSEGIHVPYSLDDSKGPKHARFTLSDLKRHDAGVFYFANAKGEEIALQKSKPAVYSMASLMV